MKTILEALIHIRDNGPINGRLGICTNINALLGSSGSHRFFYESGYAYQTWPHYSGDYSYPVPAPNERADAPIYAQSKARDWYRGAVRDGVVWDRDTRYGALRYDLLDHLIKHFEELEQ